MESSSSNHGQRRLGGKKKVEMGEIVRHMSNLPSYLERGKPIQDRALNFGVMDWGRLEQWQYHRQKEGVFGSNKYSPSSSNSSLLSTSDRSSQSSSPAPPKPDRATLRSHLNVSPEDIVKSCSGNLNKSQDDCTSKKKTTNRSQTKPRDYKMNDIYPPTLSESKSSDDLESFQTASSSSSSKGKIKIQDQNPSYETCDGALFEKHKTLVRDPSGYSRINNDIPRSCPHETKEGSEKIPSRSFQSMSLEEEECSVSSKNSDFRTVNVASNKPRRGFSFSIRSDAIKSEEFLAVSHQTHTSPLRRLLDSEDSKAKAKLKLDFGSCKEVRIDDSRRNNKMNESSSSTTRALFQMAVKNGRPLFTFTVDDNVDILAATVRSLSGKDDSNRWIYTFFTVHEVKKKKNRWLSHGSKGTSQGYLPNVIAQMKVSNPGIVNRTTREFVLSSVDPDPGRLDHENFDSEPQDELAAIVVEFLRKTDEEEDEDCFSTTVILPGGHHSVPSKGEPSPLIKRWRSGGVCDCGGWDVGCRLRTLANKVQSDRSSNSPGKFDLLFQGDAINNKPFFSLSPLTEGIFSVEYNSSLSLLEAFSICISVIECRKSSQHTELRTYVAKQVDDDIPVKYASLPPLSPVGRV